MEEEARVILAVAVASDDADNPAAKGLGSRISGLFAHIRLEEPISEWQGHVALPADFDAAVAEP
jgi:hypothetical protein